MQMLIDTATDDPAHIYAQAKMLLALFETVPASPKEAAPKAAEGLKIAPLDVPHGGSSRGIDTPPPPPPPPPPPSASTAMGAAGSTANLTSGSASALIDSAGVKWDSKLHTSTKTKDMDGRWKPRKPRDTTPPAPPSVPAGTNTPSPPPPPPVSMAAPPTPPPPSVLVPSSDDDPEVNVESDTGGSSVVPPGTPQGIDFATFIVQITTALNAGEITQARINEVQNKFSIVSLFSLNEGESAKLQDVAKEFGFVS
jgi:hypothetical protein